MHVIEWLLTGLIAGIIARVVLKKTHMTLMAELALGSIGGLLTGTLMRFMSILSPSSEGGVHIIFALIGAIGMISAMHLAVRITRRASRLIGGKIKAVDFESVFSNMGEREKRVVRQFIKRHPVARNVNTEAAEQVTLGQRAADKIAGFGGSWAFIGLFTAGLSAWMLFNVETTTPFDPYPFILLNLVLSCVAALQAPVILMSQNRQAEKDRLHAQLDYEVNLKAEVEILALHDKVDELRNEDLKKTLIELNQRQLQLLEDIKQICNKS